MTKDGFSVGVGGIRLAPLHKLNARRDHVACHTLFILELVPRHGGVNNNAEALARSCLAQIFLRGSS
jgi:hypothetical protein